MTTKQPNIGAVEAAAFDDKVLSLETSGERTDHYKVIAEKVYDIPYARITEAQRKAVKTCIWGARYGMSTADITRTLLRGISHG